MITVILKTNDIALDSASLGEIFEGMGKSGSIAEEWVGRCNTPLQQGYTRVMVEKSYVPAFEMLKATVAKPVLVAEEKPIEGGGKEEPVVKGDPVKEPPVAFDKATMLSAVSAKMEISVKMTAELAKAEAFVAEEKPLGIQVIDVEYDGQKMFQVGVDTLGNPEWLHMHTALPAYHESVEGDKI